ncbi:hypothetical protein D3C81_2223650 [compost metagenome]
MQLLMAAFAHDLFFVLRKGALQRRHAGVVEQALGHREQHVVLLGDVRAQECGEGRGGGGEVGGL